MRKTPEERATVVIHECVRTESEVDCEKLQDELARLYRIEDAATELTALHRKVHTRGGAFNRAIDRLEAAAESAEKGGKDQ